MKKGDVIRQKCVNTTFYLTGILAHKVNNIINIIKSSFNQNTNMLLIIRRTLTLV